MRNAINLAMWTEIARLTEELVKDDSVRAVVYRGAGTEAFASGADISEFPGAAARTPRAPQRYNATTAAAYAAVRECAKPTIAMIYGFCMGGAMGLAMACDLRFAAEGSKFGIPAARLSIIYPRRGHRPARGPGRARLREGHPVLGAHGGATARRWRSASSSAWCRRPSCERTTYDYLALVADNAPALGARLQGRRSSPTWPGSPTSSRARLRALSREATESEDYREGTRAFLEKRRPTFQGR